jgi:hypothetical protein
MITVIGDGTRSVPGAVTDDRRITVGTAELAGAFGWELKPEGLCRDDVCVPVRDRDALYAPDGALDLAAVASALGRPSVVDADAGVIAIAYDAEARRRALTSLDAPPFTLDDLDGNAHALDEWRGRKKLLVAFASW